MTAHVFELHALDHADAVVADGVEFDDGVCVVHGRAGEHSTSVHRDMDAVRDFFPSSRVDLVRPHDPGPDVVL